MITTPIVDCVTDIGNGKEKGDMTDRSINRSDKRCVWSLIHLVDFFFFPARHALWNNDGKEKEEKNDVSYLKECRCAINAFYYLETQYFTVTFLWISSRAVTIYQLTIRFVSRFLTHGSIHPTIFLNLKSIFF
jgi:hypothetical protein